MAQKDKPLYISVDEQHYKNNKTAMLNSQIDILNSMKHLHAMKQIKDEKFKIKLRLYSLFSSLMQDIEKLDEKLPEVAIPKLSPDVPKEKVKIAPIKKTDLRSRGIEDELREIQEKLRKLNSR